MKKSLYIILVIILVACSKGAKDYTFKDYKSEDNVDAKTAIQKEYGDEGLALIKEYEARLNSDNKEPDYTMSLVKIIEEQKGYLLALAPRKEIYNLAIEELKKELKHSSTARFTALSLNNSDSLSFSFNDDSTEVRFKVQYHAQNSYGTYLSDNFHINFMKDNNRVWVKDERTYFYSSPFWGFNHKSTKDEVIKALDSSNYKYTIVKDKDGFDVLAVKDYELFFYSESKEVKVYFNGNKIHKFIVTLKRGEDAINSYKMIKEMKPKPGTIHNIDAFVFEDAYFYVGESTANYTFFTIENK